MKQEKFKNTSNLICGILFCLAFFIGSAYAQNTAPATSNEGNSGSSETNTATQGGYKITSSVEFGVRGLRLNGSENKYRSDLNYKNGFRVFDSTFLATAEDSAGKPFDSLLLTTSGWGADRSGYARINMEKLKWYQFDASIRRTAYFNNLNNIALGQHTRDTNRTFGDFDLTVLPQNRTIKFRFGYSFNKQTGSGTTTYDYDRDEFPVSTELDSSANDVRFGVDVKVLGFNLSFTEGYRRFRDDTTFSINGLVLGNNPNPNASLSTFSRTMPERGRTYFHQFTFHRNFKKWVDLTGRFIYSDAKVDFVMTDRLTGRNRSGNPIVLDEATITGDTSRPNAVGDFGFTVRPTDKFRISNTFGFNSYRISGGHVLFNSIMLTNPAGTPLPTSLTRTLIYRFTNYRRFINTLEGDYDVNRYFSFYLGYRYTNRRVILDRLDVNLINSNQTASDEEAENTTNSLLAGFKAKPVPNKWSIYFDIEHGAADNAFTRLANYDFTHMRFRNKVNASKDLSFNLSFETKDNSNPGLTTTTPAANFEASVKTRIFSSYVDWSPDPRANFSTGYTFHRIDSEVPVIFPVNNVFGQGISKYDLKSNYFFVDLWAQPHPRFSAFAAYRITKDTGEGNQFAAATYFIGGNYPLHFQSPEVRLIFKLHRNVDWNVGYQYFNYKERFGSGQNYNAHLPYTSLRIYFGGSDR